MGGVGPKSKIKLNLDVRNIFTIKVFFMKCLMYGASNNKTF